MPNKSITRIEGILQFYTKALGKHYNAYRNHVYRVYHLTLLYSEDDLSRNELEALAIAAAFHDLGIWTHRTMDYLAPSQDLAIGYMKENVCQDEQLVTLLLQPHHKITAVKSSILVESFRKADLIDLSFGAISLGLPRKLYHDLTAEFPYLNFHRIIFWRVISYAFTHLLKPFPMMKI
jgi:hypothetical protein